MRKIGIVLIALLGISFAGISQEIDDMYFNSSDRKKVRKEAKRSNEAVEFQSPDQYEFSDIESLDSPETIEEYQNEAKEKNLQYQSPYNSANVFSNYTGSEDQQSLSFNYQQEAYDQGYEDGFSARNSNIINNYYGNNVRPRWNGGLGFNTFYDPWYGWGNGMSISLGWGAGWGFYDPFFDPWFNDPFFGWGRPYGSAYSGWGWNQGWGWNRGWRRPWVNGLYCPSPLYDYGGNYIATNTPSKEIRKTQRGPRAGMGSSATQGVRSSTRGSSSVANVNSNGYSSQTRNTYINRNGDEDGPSANRTYTRRVVSPDAYQNRTSSDQAIRNSVIRKNTQQNQKQGTSYGNRNYGKVNLNALRSQSSGSNRNVKRSKNSSTNRRTYSAPNGGSSNRSSSATKSSSSSNRSSSTRSSSSSGSSRNSGGRSSSSRSKRGN